MGGGQADVLADGRMLLTAPKGGKRDAIMDWKITDAQGHVIAQVRYVGVISRPATRKQLNEFNRGAVEALVANSRGLH